jgi:MFS family permease
MLQQSVRATWPAESFAQAPTLGLKQNWQQFSLLMFVNAFVGAMVGLERAVLPLWAARDFGLASNRAILSFIVAFGIVKAVTNLVAGRQAEKIGRKSLLVAGWVAGVPVPFMLWWAPSWAWVTAANMLLGVNQGLCWSTTVVMKIDLVGPRRRGLAMGLNEFAGYGAVALATWLGAIAAGAYGFRTSLFMLGLAFSVMGLILSVLFVRDTTRFAESEGRARTGGPVVGASFRRVFVETSVTDRSLSACSQAGLVNNLNDGLAWGLFPLLFASAGLTVGNIGLLAGLYPAVWSVSQIATGALSDRWGRKWPIAAGMWVQAIGIWLVSSGPNVTQPYVAWLSGIALLGIGTALVYPALLAAIGDHADPRWRASAVGVYRFWRDMGYAVGAVLSGVLADRLGIRAAIVAVGFLTFASGIVVAIRMIDDRRL